VCGIAGIFRATGAQPADREVVASMMQRLVRRGPDADGLDQEPCATLGHRRLSILDLSPAGRQPMVSASGRLVVSFNGEIYNYRDLRDELGLAPSALRSTSDTEILLEAWERWGPEALPRLAGQWAFAMYDREARRLWLARDRFGEKPLFWHEADGALTFASSLGALLAAPWVPGELDRDALAEFLALRYAVAPRTVLRDVRKLPGGHLLSTGADGFSVRPWFEPRFRRATGRRRRREDLIEEFGARLKTAAARCLVSDVPVALLLSDGIDSNAVLAALKEAGRDVPCFTYRAVRNRESLPAGPPTVHGVPTTDIVLTPSDRMAYIEPCFASFTEPVGDGAALATWLLIRNARPHATVFLCGHGGDEVLGGYRISQDRFRLALLHRLAWLPSRRAVEAYAIFTYGDDAPAARRAALRRARAADVPAIARYLIHRPLPRPQVDDLFGGTGAAPGPYLGTVERLYRETAPDGTAIDRIQEVMIRSFLAEDILSFADSVAMDSSAELRMPLLDRDVVDFVFGLPDDARVSRWPGHANTKRILRWWGERHIPPAVLTAPKKTFPYGSIRGLLREHGPELRELLLGSSAVRRALPGLEAWVGHDPEFFHGPREGTLWALLSLSVWAEAAGLR
jgi:asparagine synthase (glutamine-hydrolysing)